ARLLTVTHAQSLSPCALALRATGSRGAPLAPRLVRSGGPCLWAKPPHGAVFRRGGVRRASLRAGGPQAYRLPAGGTNPQRGSHKQQEKTCRNILTKPGCHPVSFRSTRREPDTAPENLRQCYRN